MYFGLLYNPVQYSRCQHLLEKDNDSIFMVYATPENYSINTNPQNPSFLKTSSQMCGKLENLLSDSICTRV